MIGYYPTNVQFEQYFYEDAFGRDDLLSPDRIIGRRHGRGRICPSALLGKRPDLGGRRERDLSDVLGENMETLQDTLLVLGNISIDNLRLTGCAGAWTVFKVADVTEDTYLLEYCVGVNIVAGLNLQLTGDLPREGIYDLRNLTKESKVVCVDASLEFAITSHGFATIDKATQGIRRINSTAVLTECISFTASNFPKYSTSGTIMDMKVNMTFADFAIYQNMHLNLKSTMDFAPALPLLQFPLTVGDEWNVDSKMTLTGEACGYFNATGLPAELTSAFDVNGGVFNGSVRIQDLTNLGPIPLENGNFGPIEQDIQTIMECVGTTSMEVSGHNLTVFDVKETQSGIHLFYSPDIEFLASALVEPQIDMLSDMITLPGGSLTSGLDLNAEISMVVADPIKATNEISQIGADQGVVPVILVSPTDTGSAGAAQGSNFEVFFIAAAVVIAIGVGAVMLLRARTPKGP